MKKIKDKSKMYMILGISFLVLAVLGSAYAYYKYVIATINVDTITRGLDYYINYTKGTDITSSTLSPGTDYTSGNNLSVTLYKKDNTYTIYGHIYLDISNISANLSSSNALKYAVLEGSAKISEGTLGGTSSGESYLLAVNIPLKTTSTKYTVYLWFDETSSKASTAENTSISATVRCEATMKEIDDEPYTYNAAAYIKSLYNSSTKTTVINNSINYEYDTTNSLMKDVGGNIRYYGASPNNYIYFNCSDYSNQSSTTCETWRIIGVFDGKLKLIRGSQIGSYSWDNKNESTGAETGGGKNDWTDARLMKLLNPGYESETTGGSLYYNAKSGNCYAGEDNATITCNFTSAGIKNDTTRSLIADTIYYLGGHNSSSVYPNQIYEKERGTAVYSGRPTTWQGKIALPYQSDYGYAANLGKCLDKNLASYNDATCTSNNWMKAITASSSDWLLTSDSDNAYGVSFISSFGDVYYYNSSTVYGITPVLYLNPEIGVKGTGSSSAPYQISA
ncbi:unknown [Firmicutes bacterium CAG:321]|nr:unknown [Firmicutes bacterium CAG:321]